MIGVEVKTPKNVRIKGHRGRGLWNRISRRAMKRIEDGITKQGRDGTGKRIPKLKGGSHFAPESDLRFEHGKPVWINAGTEGKRIRARLADSYADAKRKNKAKPKRDGSLSGDMWKSLKPKIEIRRGQVWLRLQFTGSSVVSKVGTGIYSIRSRKEKTRNNRVANRDKALWIQYSGKGASGRRLFELMAVPDDLVDELVEMILAELRLEAG